AEPAEAEAPLIFGEARVPTALTRAIGRVGRAEREADPMGDERLARRVRTRVPLAERDEAAGEAVGVEAAVRARPPRRLGRDFEVIDARTDDRREQLEERLLGMQDEADADSGQFKTPARSR